MKAFSLLGLAAGLLVLAVVAFGIDGKPRGKGEVAPAELDRGLERMEQD
jgi:hypothetical protein